MADAAEPPRALFPTLSLEQFSMCDLAKHYAFGVTASAPKYGDDPAAVLQLPDVDSFTRSHTITKADVEASAEKDVSAGLVGKTVEQQVQMRTTKDRGDVVKGVRLCAAALRRCAAPLASAGCAVCGTAVKVAGFTGSLASVSTHSVWPVSRAAVRWCAGAHGWAT